MTKVLNAPVDFRVGEALSFERAAREVFGKVKSVVVRNSIPVDDSRKLAEEGAQREHFQEERSFVGREQVNYQRENRKVEQKRRNRHRGDMARAIHPMTASPHIFAHQHAGDL